MTKRKIKPRKMIDTALGFLPAILWSVIRWGWYFFLMCFFLGFSYVCSYEKSGLFNYSSEMSLQQQAYMLDFLGILFFIVALYSGFLLCKQLVTIPDHRIFKIDHQQPDTSRLERSITPDPVMAEAENPREGDLFNIL